MMAEVGKLQAFLNDYFIRIARRINSDPALLAGFQQSAGKSILVVLSDINDGGGPPAAGLFLDVTGSITIADPQTVRPSLTVETKYKTFMDIMDAKLDIDVAFSYNMLNVFGARFMADYIIIREFFRRLQKVGGLIR